MNRVAFAMRASAATQWSARSARPSRRVSDGRRLSRRAHVLRHTTAAVAWSSSVNVKVVKPAIMNRTPVTPM